jgi:tetratricopeptide (TPR) repeat protein
LLASPFAAPSAQAAASVIGGGLAHSCYIQAEYNVDPRNSIQLCSDALANETLSRTDRASTLINRAILRAHSADLQGAMTDYSDALQIGGNDAEVYLNRSATLIAMRRYADALKDANAAIGLQPAHVEIAYFNRGLANESLGNVKAAYTDYKMALSIQPQFAAAADALARFRVKTDNS